MCPPNTHNLILPQEELWHLYEYCQAVESLMQRMQAGQFRVSLYNGVRTIKVPARDRLAAPDRERIKRLTASIASVKKAEAKQQVGRMHEQAPLHVNWHADLLSTSSLAGPQRMTLWPFLIHCFAWASATVQVDDNSQASSNKLPVGTHHACHPAWHTARCCLGGLDLQCEGP